MIQLGKQGIDEFPSFLTVAYNKLNVIGSNDHAGVMADVLGKPCIQFVVWGKLFFAGFAKDANCLFRFTIELEMPFQPEALMSLVDVHAILAGKITFGKTQIVYCIQQIGLANPVAATNANDAFFEFKLLMKIVFKLVQRYGVDV